MSSQYNPTWKFPQEDPSFPPTITRMSIEIIPDYIQGSHKHCRVQVEVNGLVYQDKKTFSVGDFDNLFDMLVDYVRDGIKSLVKAEKEKEKTERTPQTFGDAIEFFGMAIHENQKQNVLTQELREEVERLQAKIKQLQEGENA